MIKNKYHHIIFIFLCLIINYTGRALSGHFGFPIWFDSFGTVLCAYVLGPVNGAITGFSSNLIYGLDNLTDSSYGITSIAIAVIVGIAAKRKNFRTVFGTMNTGMLLAIVSLFVSVPLNFLFYGGTTGNLWGDGVIGFLQEQGLPFWLSALIGQFYIEFLDKLIMVLLLYLVIKIFHFYKKYNNKISKNTISGILCSVIAIGPFLYFISPAGTDAANYSPTDTIGYHDYIRTVYSNDTGLPCGEANDIAETNDGILWIGTYAGLYRYNGKDFKWMNEYESVRNVNCMYVDSEGRLWIGTNDNGLSIAINEKIVNVIDEKAGLPSNSVRCITQCSDGEYYIGTTTGMQVLSLSNGLRVLNTLPAVSYTNDISSDKSGNIAAVTSSGELFLIKEKAIYARYLLPTENEIYISCVFSPEGLLYVGTSENRILIYDISSSEAVLTGEMKCHSLSYINDMYFADDGKIFISAYNGIGYFDNNTFHDINTGTFNTSVNHILIDYQGNLWFSSTRLGLLRMSRASFIDIYGAAGIDRKVVNTVEKWNGILYFGTDKGIDATDEDISSPIEDEITSYFDGMRIRCLHADQNGHLWVSTYGKGLMEVFPDKTVKVYTPDTGIFGERARSVISMSDGSILAAGDTGFSLIKDGNVIYTLHASDGLNNEMILSLLENDDGKILAGTDGDGIAVIENGKVVRRLTRENGLSSGVIMRLVNDPMSAGIFIVTSNGLCFMDENYTIRKLNNFPYYNNYDIWVKDKYTVFVTSSAGVYAAEREALLSGRENITFELLDSKRGLTGSLTANAWKYIDENNNIYLPCDIGAFCINANNYSSKNTSYRMIVSSVKLDDKLYRTESGRAIEISRDTDRIEFFPEVINFTLEDPYVSYYLEGFETERTLVPQSKLANVVYTNIPAGKYIFHLAVHDKDGRQMLEEIQYNIVKEKEIYDNGWFLLYIFLTAMLAVAWFTWFIVRTQVQRTINFQRKELEFAKKQVMMGNETILAIAKTVDAKDENTSQHSQRVSEYSVMIARELGFSEKECENLRKAALLHDIGKIGIPDRILNKPTRLTDEEYAVMKSHVTRGANILKDFTIVDHVVEGALYHHEKYDGTGYVNGLKGDNIPLYGRIIGVADAFDAMTANRVYRQKLDFDYVLQEFRRCRGTQFDPKIADIMIGLVENGTINIDELYGKKDDSKESEE